MSGFLSQRIGLENKMNRSDIKIDEITAMSKRLSDLIILIDIKENIPWVIFIIFAIIGLEFYGGALNKTCYDLSDLSKT